MYVSKQTILKALPPFENKRVDIVDKQQVSDIISTMLAAHTRNAWLYDKIGGFFIGGTVAETCNNLYDFCFKNIRYDQEPDKLQTVNVPQSLLTAGHCDCKGFASFINGCLDAIKRSGKQKINWEYCFASYDPFKKTPYHVFAIAEPGENEIWIDPTPGADGKDPVWWYRKTVKTSPMLQDVVAGIGDFPAVNGVYAGKQPGMRTDQADKAASALGSLGLVSRYPQLSQTLQQPPAPVVPMPPNRVRIGDVSTPVTVAEPSLIQGVSNKTSFLGVGTLAAVYFLTHQKLKVVGSKKIKSYLPLIAAAAIGGYFLYKKFVSPFGNDPELQGFKPVAGVLNIAPGVHAGYAARMQTFPGAPQDNSFYGAVLAYGLPLYASAIAKMSVDEQMALYHLANDYPASNIDSNDPAYNALIAIRDKYKFPFY